MKFSLRSGRYVREDIDLRLGKRIGFISLSLRRVEPYNRLRKSLSNYHFMVSEYIYIHFQIEGFAVQ